MLIRNAQRKLQLVEATVEEIGAVGSLNVTVGQIAKRAGVSSALAFHYFGDKDALFLEAMRHILALYGAEMRGALCGASTSQARLEAIILTNFTPSNFRREVISAWLNFYVMAQQSKEAARLLTIYQRRLQSNLTHALRPMVNAAAPDIAMRIAALIDGLYLRAVHNPENCTQARAAKLAMAAVSNEIEAAK